ncbi:hypothetical protein GCM10027399_04590 [Curvibacter fontanus]
MERFQPIKPSNLRITSGNIPNIWISLMNKYRISISYSPEDQGYIAVAPELDGCSAFGETPAEAATEIELAIEAWIDAALAAGNPVPPPIPLNVDAKRSGKYLLRLGSSLHETVAELADAAGQSLNSYILSAIHLKIGFDAGNSIAEHRRFAVPSEYLIPSSQLISGSTLVANPVRQIRLEKSKVNLTTVGTTAQQ